MTVEGLVQNRGWNTPFGGFFQKRFNGFSVNILRVSQMDNWRITITNYDTTETALHSYIDDVKQLEQLYVLKTVQVYVLWLLKNYFM